MAEHRGPPHTKTCRTYAIVDFYHPISEAIIEEHRRIASGQSLGAVFKARAWKISKEHRYVGEISLNYSVSNVAQLMSIEAPTQLAIHIYDFRITKGKSSFLYARIAEVHHPDYLTMTDLKEIYQSRLNESLDDQDAIIKEVIRKVSQAIDSSTN
jgi:hypothetical protein